MKAQCRSIDGKEMMRKHLVTIALCALLAGAALSAAHAADPAKSAGSPVVVMDNQGRVIKTLAPEPSREAQAAKAADAERALAAAKADEEQKRKDHILLDSYTTESEIDLARNRATSVLEAQMDVAKSYVGLLAKRRAEVLKRKSEAGSKVLPADEQEIARLDGEIEQQSAILAQRRQDLDRLVARYTADKRRWQELSVKQPVSQSVVAYPAAK